MAGEVIGGPVGGMAGSAMGAYAGKQLAQQIDKKAGVGKRGSGVSKGQLTYGVLGDKYINSHANKDYQGDIYMGSGDAFHGGKNTPDLGRYAVSGFKIIGKKLAGHGFGLVGEKKKRGRPKKITDMIHIDSHNAKGDVNGEGFSPQKFGERFTDAYIKGTKNEMKGKMGGILGGQGLYDKLTLQDIEHIEKLKKEHALMSGIKDKNKVKHLKSESERLERELEQMGEKGGKKVKMSGIKGRGAVVPPSEIKPIAVKKARGAGFKKGSQEAKDHMAKIRASRGKK